jgi:tRNA-specific 2-thiouridylase
MVKVLIGMSGGIDSTVSALTLKEKGYEVIGITFKTWTQYRTPEKIFYNKDEAIKKAQNLAAKLQIEHHVVDLTEVFHRDVIKNFVEEYFCGRTPNPCVVCNKKIKFKTLVEKAAEYNCDFIATGHYARIGIENNRIFIKKALDQEKDQSYFLWKLPQEYLNKIIFPLGERYKKKIIAEHEDLEVTNESFEICFIPDNNYRNLLLTCDKKISPGDFVLNGKVVGQHKGFCFYTIGQRSGLGIAVGSPVYVKSIDTKNNIVHLGQEEDLLTDRLELRDVNMMKFVDFPEDGFECDIKIRYRNLGYKGKLFLNSEKKIVILQDKVKSITPGQSAVFYEGEDVIGGGIIC